MIQHMRFGTYHKVEQQRLMWVCADSLESWLLVHKKYGRWFRLRPKFRYVYSCTLVLIMNLWMCEKYPNLPHVLAYIIMGFLRLLVFSLSFSSFICQIFWNLHPLPVLFFKHFFPSFSCMWFSLSFNPLYVISCILTVNSFPISHDSCLHSHMLINVLRMPILQTT